MPDAPDLSPEIDHLLRVTRDMRSHQRRASASPDARSRAEALARAESLGREADRLLDALMPPQQPPSLFPNDAPAPRPGAYTNPRKGA